MPPRTHRLGFTLIELMITVAIVALLAAVAYPSYQDSVRKGRRAEARAALAVVLQQQERYLTQTGTYRGFAEGDASAGLPFKTFSGDSAAGSHYSIGARQCPAPAEGAAQPTLRDCVQLYAQPTNGHSDPQAGTLTLTSLGAKGCDDASQPETCWP